VHRLANNGEVAGGQLAVFQGATASSPIQLPDAWREDKGGLGRFISLVSPRSRLGSAQVSTLITNHLDRGLSGCEDLLTAHPALEALMKLLPLQR
jgi:hypothetical protein